MGLNSYRNIKIGVVVSYIAILINSIAALVYTPWMIEQIGQSNYGIYTLAISLIAMFSLDFGLSTATMRFVSKYRAEHKTSSINDFLGIICKLYLMIAMVLAAVLFVLYFYIPQIYDGLTSSEIVIFREVYIIVSFYTIISFPFIPLNGILMAYEEFSAVKMCDIANKILTVVFIVIALCFNATVLALVVINALVGIALIIAKVLIIRRRINLKVNYFYKNKVILKSIFAFTAWSTIAQVFQRLIFNITPSILGMVSNATAMSVFAIAMSLEGYSYTFSNVLGNMFLPSVSTMIADGKGEEEIQRLSTKIGRIQVLISGIIFAGFVLVGREFILLWLDESFMIAYYCTALLIFPNILQSALQIPRSVILAKNFVKSESVAYVIMGVVNVVLSLIFSSHYGALGASVSIFIAYLIRTTMTAVVCHRKVGINMKTFSKDVYLRIGMVLLGCIVVGMFINTVWQADSWMMLICKISAIGSLLCGALWVGALDASEKSLICGIITKGIKRISQRRAKGA